MDQLVEDFKGRLREELESGKYDYDDIDVEELQDKDFKRFIIGKQYNIEVALKVLLESLVFRKENQIKDITFDDVKDELESNRITILGYDHIHRLVAVVRTRNHYPNSSRKAACERMLLYFAERAKNLLNPENEQCIILFDLTDFVLPNMDYDIIRYMIRVFTDYYPETLGILLIVNSPWIFKGCWKLVKPLMDPNTAKKIQFVSHPKLVNYMDEEILTPDLGGTNENIVNYGLGV